MLPARIFTVRKRCVTLLRRKPEVSETSAVLEVFKFIENAAAEFSDEDEDEDNEGRDRTNVESRTVRDRPTDACKQNRCCLHTPCSLHPDPQKEADLVVVPRQYGHQRGPRHRGSLEGL